MPTILSLSRVPARAKPTPPAVRRQPAVPADAARAAAERRRSAPIERLPRVSVHLPVCNEPPETVRRTLDALSRLDYPDFDVLVVDSNTDDPARWEPVAEHCARLGARFRFFHLGDWPGRKAGALNFALGETVAEAALIAVVDSNELVRPDWLRQMVPHFIDPAVGFALSPRAACDASPWAPTAAEPPSGVLRQEATLLVRHSALTQAGGWAEWAVAEDAELGLRLLRAGWRGAWSPEALVGHPAPQGFAACAEHRFVQVYGAIQACRHHLPSLLSPFGARLPLRQRMQPLAGCTGWLYAAFALLLMGTTLLWSIGLLLSPQGDGFPAMPLILCLLLLYAASLVPPLWFGTGHQLERSAVAETALQHSTAKAVWTGLLAPSAHAAEPGEAAQRSGVRQGVQAAREELLLLLLTWGIAAGIAVSYGAQGAAPWLWCGLLIAQSLPCAAAVFSAARRTAPLPVRLSAWPIG